MNTTDLAHFRARLLALRASLTGLEEAGREGAATVELDQTRVGRLSRMDAMQAQAMSQNAQRRRQAGLRDIERALARIDTGQFGDCSDCGEPVNPARLRADPTATICIDCANKREA